MSKPKLTSLLFLKTESRYKNKLTTESCFHLHKILDSVVLWEIPRDIMEELSDANGDIAYLYRSFFENSLMLSQLKADILRFESANDRYARLQQHFPEITRRAPLTMIASYLQMTLETLSRVRASIANAESK